jgi:uncharacterized coiled-coil protein SlyX
MRRPIIFALVTVIALLSVATVVLVMKYRKTSADYVATKAAEQTARARYAETIDAIVEIQDSLSAIALGDTTVRMLAGDLLAEQRLRSPDGREALDRIAVLRAGILRSKAMIHELESRLHASGNRIAGLERMVARLKQTVSEKEEFVARLSTQVDSLQTRVVGLVTEVQQSQDTLRIREQTLTEKQRELATVFYVVGTRKDLTASGIVVAKGGLLGVGRTLLPSGQYSESMFVPLDTDQQTVILTSSAKARVLSAQPPWSYQLKLVNGRMQLHILDPAEFRKIRRVVILTA